MQGEPINWRSFDIDSIYFLVPELGAGANDHRKFRLPQQ
jgi:hypothetical protein